MARINPKTGLPYVKGVKFAEQEKWKVTVSEIFTAIRNDPDLTKSQKIQAIRVLSQKNLGDYIDGNTSKEQLALLNKLYQKAHGVTADKQTPFATFIKDIILRRGRY